MASTSGSVAPAWGGFTVPRWIWYLNAPADAVQLSVGFVPVTAPLAGAVALKPPGAAHAAPAVRNVEQVETTAGQDVPDRLAATLHSYDVPG